jgi:AcrR family transcriptional regulator
MGARTSTRGKMLTGAVELLGERGAAGVTIDAVLLRSKSPRGSVYHHFRGGRAELIEDALTAAGEEISRVVEAAARGESDPAAVVRRFGRFWGSVLRDSDFAAGCPVVSVAIGGAPDDDQLRPTAADIFARWQRALSAPLVAAGVAEDRANRLATMAVSALEGAVVLCRVQGSTEPLEEVLAELEPLFVVDS